MLALLHLILSGNFLIGAIVGILSLAGYLYYTGSTINWVKPKG